MKKCTLLVIACLLSLTITNAQNIITVDNTLEHNAQFSDLQQAIDSASPGDIIYVQQSPNSYGSITVDLPLTLIGRSAGITNGENPLTSGFRFISQLSDVTFSLGSTGSKIEGFALSSISIGSGLNESNDASIQNITISNNRFSSLSLFSGSDNSPTTASPFLNNIVVRGNFISSGISGGSSNGVFNTIIRNNIFGRSGNISLFTSTSTIISNNLFWVDSNGRIIDSLNPNINVDNNVFLYNQGSVPLVNPIVDQSINLHNNLTFNYGGGTAPLAIGPNSNSSGNLIDVDPQFTSVDFSNNASVASDSFFNSSTLSNFVYLDDLTPAAGSPLIDAAFGTGNIGVFDGTFEFRLMGTVVGIPQVIIQNTTSFSQDNGTLEIVIEAKSN